jgi:hypothetical protein
MSFRDPTESDWPAGAPDPDAVINHVAIARASRLGAMGVVEVRRADHADLALIVLAARYYHDIDGEAGEPWFPPAARPVADLHRRFAAEALRLSFLGDDDDDTVAALARTAERCLVARGPACRHCSRPACLHATPCGE